MKISTAVLTVLSVVINDVSAWAPPSFSIASGLPQRRSVVKYNIDEKVPEDVLTSAAEG